MIEVVTVYTPRPGHSKFTDFLPLLDLQKQTCEKFGHKHVVVSDVDIPGFNVWKTAMPHSLMAAIMTGQSNYLQEGWSGQNPLVLVDVDCLVARDLRAAFDGTFDLAITSRPDDAKSPVNNGAMYCGTGNPNGVRLFFMRAQRLCKKHWGGDQEAIAAAASPIPSAHGVYDRAGLRILFASMRTHNVVPAKEGARHKCSPFIVHFKGDRKDWMATYANSFILAGK
jgi:hypothetical protein